MCTRNCLVQAVIVFFCLVGRAVSNKETLKIGPDWAPRAAVQLPVFSFSATSSRSWPFFQGHFGLPRFRSYHAIVYAAPFVLDNTVYTEESCVKLINILHDLKLRCIQYRYSMP